MKAFLLAGGRGERLRPFTDHLPKCLVPIGGVPLLRIWLDLCKRSGVEKVLVNVSRNVGAVDRALHESTPEIAVRVVEEREPIGNAGTVLAHRDFVEGEDDFLVLYADNLTDARLEALVAFHQSHAEPLTMGLFRTADPAGAGIVELGEQGEVCAFHEKPTHAVSNLANAGVYVCRPALFDAIPRRSGIVDFAIDVFPALRGQLRAQLLAGYVQDIGTPEGLARARRDWPHVIAAAMPPASSEVRR
jgi:mannose-1-phosphate guanylyltransferase